MLYLALWITFSLGYLVSVSKAWRSAAVRRILPASFLLILSALAGIKWRTGTDWNPYLEFYTSGGTFQDYMSYYHFEPGFKFIIWLLHYAGVNYSLWLFLLTFLVLVIKLGPIYNRPYVIICFLVLFGDSMADLFPTREAIAVSIVFLSAYFLVQRRYFLYVICVLLASMFHATAIIFLLAPLILAAGYRLLLILAVAIGVILKLILYAAVTAIASYFGLAGVLAGAEIYSQTVAGRVSVLSIGQKLVVLLFSLGVLSRCKSEMTRFELAAVKLMFFGMVASIFLESGSQILNRLTIYFVAFEVIAVSALLWIFSKYLISKRAWLALLFVFAGACTFYAIRFYGLLSAYPDLYYPFETIFQSSHRVVY